MRDIKIPFLEVLGREEARGTKPIELMGFFSDPRYNATVNLTLPDLDDTALTKLWVCGHLLRTLEVVRKFNPEAPKVFLQRWLAFNEDTTLEKLHGSLIITADNTWGTWSGMTGWLSLHFPEDRPVIEAPPPIASTAYNIRELFKYRVNEYRSASHAPET